MIIAGMATIPGREEACIEAVKSIYGQVDWLWVCMNDFGIDERIFFVERLQDISAFICWNTCQSGGDENKFYGAIFDEDIHDAEYYFSLDDDLIYPPDYVRRTISQFTDKPEILTYHGRTIQGPITSYYQQGHQPRAHVLHSLDQDIYVNIPGTGCMAFRPKDFTLKADDFPAEFPLMADIHVGVAAQRQGIPVRALKHDAGWIVHSDKVKMVDTIYGKYKNADALQVQRCNSIQWQVN